MSGLIGKAKTFKERTYEEKGGSKRLELRKKLSATLGVGDLTSAVKLPEGEDENEWIAVNVVDFYNQINLLYSSIAKHCNSDVCPTMTGGPRHEYLWADGTTIKKPIKCSAPEYADYLMNWVQEQFQDERIFPTDESPFPANYLNIVKTIFKRLFRIYAHIYYKHVPEMVEMGVEAHLNTGFKHFYLFVKEFDLVDDKEMEPLEDHIERIKQQLAEK